MAQRTISSAWDVAWGNEGGVRGLADQDNFRILSWYNEDAYLWDTVRILSMDYFASSNVVDLCRAINFERGQWEILE